MAKSKKKTATKTTTIATTQHSNNMTDIMINRRVAMARLEAALIHAELASHDKVAVRIAVDGQAEAVRMALAAKCSDGDSEITTQSGGNMITLEGLYGDPGEITHAVVDAEHLKAPKGIREALKDIKSEIDAAAKKRKKEGNDFQFGWTLMASQNLKDEIGVVLRINTSSYVKKLRASRHAEVLSKGLGVRVVIEEGQVAKQHALDKWATAAHNNISIGVAIGNDIGTGTVALPVKYINDSDIPAGENAGRVFQYLTAGHCFYRAGEKLNGQPIYQPPDNRNPNRRIGEVVDSDYSPVYKSQIFNDAALISGRYPPSYVFGDDSRELVGLWKEEVTSESRCYVYGARTGQKSVIVENAGDTIASVLTSEGVHLIYRDMISISDEKRKASPTRPGDSGAPLMVRKEDQYFVFGMVVCGPYQKSNYQVCSSYAIPVERLLKRLRVANL